MIANHLREPDIPPLVDAGRLRQAGRQPPLPFRIALDSGQTLTVQRILRLLPGKRVVGEARLEDRPVLAKLFIAKRSNGRHFDQERRGLELLVAQGVSTPGIVAAGAINGGGRYLLTDFLADATSLADAWQDAQRRAGADMAAALPALYPALEVLGRMHARGLTQSDLHLGNFLRHQGMLYVIDGDGVQGRRAGRPLGAQDAARNLAVLVAQLPAATDPHLDSLLAAYCSGTGETIRIDEDRLRIEIERVRGWRLRDYLAKSLRDCTLFIADSRRDRFVAAVRSDVDTLAPVIDDPDAWMQRGTVLKDGNTSTVVRIDLDGRPLVIKRYNIKNAGHALSRCWRPTRAWHSWIEGHRLDFLGIGTPRPLALIERRFGPLRGRAWLITEYCGGPDLKTHLAGSEDVGAPEAERTAISALFARLKAERLTHGDLKATNLLWCDGQLMLIDLDAMRQHARDLTFAKAWRKDRARFLRNWTPGSTLHRWLCAHFPEA